MQTAAQNLRKFVRSLHTKQGRAAEKLFLVEGEKLGAELLNSSLDIDSLIVREPLLSESIKDLASEYSVRGVKVSGVSEKIFDQLCDTKSPQGVVALAVIPEPESFPQDESFVMLDGINDPGNLGTIIRTAEWFGIRNIVIGENSADAYNPKTVRASMGSLFRVRIFQDTRLEEFLRQEVGQHELYGATLEGKTSLQECIPKGRFGIVMGSESHGISGELRKLLTAEYRIPGSGKAESLNVAVAAGISLYHFSGFVQD